MPRQTGWKRALEIFLLLAVLLFGGMAVGRWTAAILAHDHALAVFIGSFMLPLSLGIGMTMWYSIAHTVILSRLTKAVWTHWRAGRSDAQFRDSVKESLQGLRVDAPPGTFVFVPVSLVVCFIAGVLIAFAPAVSSRWLAIGICTGMGLAYGLLLWRLARSGKLPIPEEA